jgi:hypothetical protein
LNHRRRHGELGLTPLGEYEHTHRSTPGDQPPHRDSKAVSAELEQGLLASASNPLDHFLPLPVADIRQASRRDGSDTTAAGDRSLSIVR